MNENTFYQNVNKSVPINRLYANGIGGYFF